MAGFIIRGGFPAMIVSLELRGKVAVNRQMEFFSTSYYYTMLVGRELEHVMVNKLDEALRFNQTALSLRGARQELLASNVANADTPGYKARDIDFASALQNALSGSSAKLPMVTSSGMHLEGNAGNSVMGAPVLYRRPDQMSADGNTVNMDMERAQAADNALHYEVGVVFVNAQLKNMTTALQP